MHRFVNEYSEGIGDSALHVYDSALLFTPRNTTLFKTYRHEFTTSVGVSSSVKITWDPGMEYLSHIPMWISSTMRTNFSAFHNIIMEPWGSAKRHRRVVIREYDSPPIEWVGVCPDGSKFISKSKGEMRLCKTQTGKRIFTSNCSNTPEFSPDSKHFVYIADKELQLRDTLTGKLIATFFPTEVLFSPDGTRIVTAKNNISGNSPASECLNLTRFTH